MQAERLRALWERFSLDAGQPTYIAIDAWQYGRSVLEALVKPHVSGINLACVDHLEENVQGLEQQGALELIYPVKAGPRGFRDPDAEMFMYARVEWEHGNVFLLTGDSAEGLEQYKRRNGIKTDDADLKILQPYYKTNELCDQIMNLRVSATSSSEREERISQYIQRDSWSAVKYALWFAHRLEEEKALSRVRRRSSWTDAIEQAQQATVGTVYRPPVNNRVTELLKLRKWR